MLQDTDLSGVKAWLLQLPEDTIVGTALPGAYNRPCPLEKYVLETTGQVCEVSPTHIEFNMSLQCLPDDWIRFVSLIDVGNPHPVTREEALEAIERIETNGKGRI